MKRFLFTTVAFGVLALPAMAADMNPAPIYRAPVAVPIVPVFAWTGCYVGGTVGGASVRSTDTWSANSRSGRLRSGLRCRHFQWGDGDDQRLRSAGGVEGGCNYQVSPFFVVGVEADWEGTSLSGSRTGSVNVPGFVGPDGFNQSFNSHWLSTVRGRAGYAAGPWLFYATAGLAIANVSFADSISLPRPRRQLRLGQHHGHGLDGRRRHRVDVRSKLDRQGRVSLRPTAGNDSPTAPTASFRPPPSSTPTATCRKASAASV